jgi:hypothetical protein
LIFTKEATMKHRLHHITGSHPHGADRFLLASVGSTPGASALFLGENRHRERASRRAMRSVIATRHHDQATDRDD